MTLFVVASLILMYLCNPSVGSSWKEVERVERDVDFPYSKVFVSTRTGFVGRSQVLSVLFVDPGRTSWTPPDDFEPVPAPNIGPIGLADGDVFHYMRLYANHKSIRCGTEVEPAIYTRPPTRGYTIPQWGHCMNSATVHAWHAGSEDAQGAIFQMNLVLQQNSSHRIRLLEGFHNCTEQLELFDNTFWVRSNTEGKRRGHHQISAELPAPCKRFATSSSPSSLLEFEYTVPAYISTGDSQVPYSFPGAMEEEDGAVCSQRDMQGYWGPAVQSGYVQLRCEGAKEKRSQSTSSLSTNKLLVAEPTELTAASVSTGINFGARKLLVGTDTNPVAGTRYPQPKIGNPYSLKPDVGVVCYVGDSHMERMHADASCVKAISAATNWQPQFVKAYAWSNSTHDSIINFKEEPQRISLVSGLKKCINMYRFCETEHNALVWWFGSHALYFSEADTVRAMNETLQATLMELRTPPNSTYYAKKKPLPSLATTCVIVVGVPDLQFEEIPIDSFGNYTRFFQNSWRVMNQNRIIRNTVSALNDSYVHFLDVFPQSLALHFDGHYPKDAVHFFPHYYQYFARELGRLIKEKCVPNE